MDTFLKKLNLVERQKEMGKYGNKCNHRNTEFVGIHLIWMCFEFQSIAN